MKSYPMQSKDFRVKFPFDLIIEFVFMFVSLQGPLESFHGLINCITPTKPI
jgi:hypothetical protein